MRKSSLPILLILFTAAFAVLPCERLSAQYYDWGQEPASIKWKQIGEGRSRFVVPDYFQNQGLQLKGYMDSVAPYSSYGFRHGRMELPLITHTQNFRSNGLVMLAPNRMEFITTPPASTYATPWLKQLAAHESRHAAQFGNLNQNVIRVLGKIFGQHGSILGLAFMPYWVMEGDAVDAETQMTAFGRGLQPSFTMEYRAMLLEGRAEGYPIDKFFGGSFVDNLPDHYHLGYQITTYANTKYGENIWDKVADYGSRRPYQLFTTHIALKRYYGTSTSKLFRETFDDLKKYWSSMPLVQNSAQIIPTPIKSYTTYSTPVEGPRGELYAFQTDMGRPTRLVEVDPQTGAERVLTYTGSVSGPLSFADGYLVWTETRSSNFWEQRVGSVTCHYDITTGRKGLGEGSRRSMFATAVDGYGLPAYVEYDYSGRYSICHDGVRLELPDTISVHGLAHDIKTDKFYFIALSDSGMWLGSANLFQRTWEPLTRAGYTTLSNLRAGNGKLYFNSIASGKDEAHVLDLSTGAEYQVTESRYGSFDPAPARDGGVLVTTYTPDGYLLARQDVMQENLTRVEYSRMPANTVNPTRYKWEGVPVIDELKIEADTIAAEVKPYRKWLNFARFHSWAPAWYEPDQILGETEFNLHLGVTFLSQNLLNSTFATLGYKYTEEGHFGTAGLRFYGLPVKFEVEAEYGTMDQLMYASRQLTNDELATLSGLSLNNYFGVTARAFLPILFDAGYHLRRVTPSVEFEHENSKVYYPYDNVSGHMRNGMQKFRAQLMYTDNVRMSQRDFLPRWGYALRATYTGNPFAGSYGSIMSAYARAYLPGIAPQHSLMLRAAAQKQDKKAFNYRQKELFPRGARFNFTPSHYGSVSVDYQFPLWHPDGGINSLLYFKRIRANLFFDYARYKAGGRWDAESREWDSRGSQWDDINSYGLDLTFDVVPLRLPASTSTSFTLSIRKPSNRSGVTFGGTFIMPL